MMEYMYSFPCSCGKVHDGMRDETEPEGLGINIANSDMTVKSYLYFTWDGSKNILRVFFEDPLDDEDRLELKSVIKLQCVC